MAKEKYKHLERIAVEHENINSDLTDKLASLLADWDRVTADLVAANARAYDMAAEKDALDKRLKSEMKRLQNSRDEMVHKEKIKAMSEAEAKCAARLEKVKKHLASREE